MTHTVVISEFMDEAAVDWLAERFEVIYQPDLHERRAELAQRLTSAQALIVRNRTQVDAGLLPLPCAIRAVGRLGVGLENIDLALCQERGIEVIPAIGANAAAVAEYVVCTAMMLLRKAYLSSADVAAGAWPRASLGAGREAAGKLLGLVGLGSVGRATADLARALGMRVQAYDPSLPATHEAWRTVGRCQELDDLFRQSDVVSLHVPLTPGTRDLVDARRLALMPADAVLINVARGGIVDERALADALSGGRLAGAAIDVFVEEPLPPESVFHGIPNLILTPHIAGVTAESNVRVSFAIAHAIERALLN
jgi:(S)-sulfolactate dehydrogenase